MPKQGTRLEVDLGALAHNYRFLKEQLNPKTLFMGVVKANAYGHGITQIANKLQQLGADYLAVAYTEEGVELRTAGVALPILVLHPQLHKLADLAVHSLEPVVYGWEILKAVSAFAKAKNKQLSMHIEFNTGLNRLGFEVNEVREIGQYVLENQLNVKGVSSHLAASEDRDEDIFTKSQIEKFSVAADQLEQLLSQRLLRHQSNTSGVLNHQKARFDIVRAGIGLYGYGNDLIHDKKLKPVGRLVTQISQIRTLQKGDTVSYNRKFKATGEMRCAVLALGHGDGINRLYGHGKAEVYINGAKAPTLGIICMDMFMVDVSNIECEVGDEVEIFGHQQNAAEFAEMGGTISYELLTGIQRRVRRVYLDDSEN
jgi:alanine racemase